MSNTLKYDNINIGNIYTLIENINYTNDIYISVRNSWSLYTAGSYRTTIRVSTRSCARTCSFRGVSPFLPRGIGEPVGKVWQTGCRNYCCHRAKPCGILRPMHAGQSGCYRNRNAIGRDERQYFGVRPARRNPQLFFRPGLALSRRLVRAGAGSPV